MKILIINNEKEPENLGWIPQLQKAIKAITPVEFIVKHYLEASGNLVEESGANLVVLSGRLSDWTEEEMPWFEQEYQLARTCTVPLLGICAGHQLLGAAFGAKMDCICKSERIVEEGYQRVWVVGRDKILEGLGSGFTVRQYHYWELKAVPPGFTLLASNEITTIQWIKDTSRPVYGVQFHPEWYNEDYPDGKVILKNFIGMASN